MLRGKLSAEENRSKPTQPKHVLTFASGEGRSVLAGTMMLGKRFSSEYFSIVFNLKSLVTILIHREYLFTIPDKQCVFD